MASTNKIALITGGSRGLGRNMALELAGKGNDVIITYRSKKTEADAVVAEIEKKGARGATLALEAGDTKSFDGFFRELSGVLKEKWGRQQFDFLVNNAGIDAASLFPQTTEEAFDSLFQVHFKGVYFLTQKALPYLADKGRIINISSGLARLRQCLLREEIDPFEMYLEQIGRAHV